MENRIAPLCCVPLGPYIPSTQLTMCSVRRCATAYDALSHSFAWPGRFRHLAMHQEPAPHKGRKNGVSSKQPAGIWSQTSRERSTVCACVPSLPNDSEAFLSKVIIYFTEHPSVRRRLSAALAEVLAEQRWSFWSPSRNSVVGSSIQASSSPEIFTSSSSSDTYPTC